MKIILVAGWFYPESIGGTERYVSALAKFFSRAGHDVRIAAPTTSAGYAESYEHGGIGVYRFPVSSNPTRDEAQFLTRTGEADAFSSWITAQSPDIVHFNTVGRATGLAEMKVAKNLGAAVIFTSHVSSLGFSCQRGTLMRWGEYACDGILGIAKCAACELQNRGLEKTIAKGVAEIPVPVSAFIGRARGKLGTALGIPALISRNRAMQTELGEIVDRFVVLTHSAARILVANGMPAEKVHVNALGISHY